MALQASINGHPEISEDILRAQPQDDLRVLFNMGWHEMYTIAIKTGGTLWAWSVNTNGNLGDSSAISRSAPVQIGNYSKWIGVSSGASHTIAVRQE